METLGLLVIMLSVLQWCEFCRHYTTLRPPQRRGRSRGERVFEVVKRIFSCLYFSFLIICGQKGNGHSLQFYDKVCNAFFSLKSPHNFVLLILKAKAINFCHFNSSLWNCSNISDARKTAFLLEKFRRIIQTMMVLL